MGNYVCILCGYIYDPKDGDPKAGIEPGRSFANLPEDWVCPICGAVKSDFAPQDQVEVVY